MTTTTLPVLGDRARDKITGFEGIVTGHCDYLTGCDQVLLNPPSKDGALVSAHWFDIDRCEVVEAQVVPRKLVTAPDGSRPGGDVEAPIR
jgi:hypothetical protein